MAIIKPRVLVVDDYIPAVETIEMVLGDYFDILKAYDGEEALGIAHREKPELILLDVIIPKIDGFDVCKQLKNNKNTSSIPVMMLSRKSETQHRITGLECGADDYLVKPFDVTELILRINSCLEKASIQGKPCGIIEIGGISLDNNAETVTVYGKKKNLTPKLFKMLNIFLRNPNKIIKRDYFEKQILETQKLEPDTKALDALFQRLKKCLGPKVAHRFIAIKGEGYKYCFPLIP